MSRARIFILCALVVLVGLLSSNITVFANSPLLEIDFVYSGKTITYKDELISPTNHLVAEEIYNNKINSPLNEKLMFVEKCVAKGSSYASAMERTFPLISTKVDAVLKITNVDAVSSNIKFNPNAKKNFSITKHALGCSLSKEALYRDLFVHLKMGGQKEFRLKPCVVNPKVSSDDNIKLTNKISSFTTDYSNSTEGRKHNILTAVKKLNGTVIKPNSEFSFNECVGSRTEANGYASAKIIVGGEYTDGIGGGVCQVSTTLYNAVLRADVSITAVKNHSLMPSYVPASFDAMVSSFWSDLKFKNNKQTPLFIKAVADGEKIKIDVYGYPLGYAISTKSVIVDRGDMPEDKEIVDTDYKYFLPSAVSGERMRIVNPQSKVKSEGYLVYKDKNGSVIKTELVRKDTYSQMQGVVVIAPPYDIDAVA